MADSIWGKLFGIPQGRGKRRERINLLQAERLEDRSLLSAGGIVPAEVAHGKAFDFPSVAGTWDITINNDPAGSATVTQNGKSVDGTYSIVGLPELNFKDKFTKKNPDSLTGKVKFKDEEIGKVTINVTITFDAATGSPTTFTGSAVSSQGGTTNFVGTKEQASALPHLGKAAPEFHDVAGTWTFSIEQDDIGEFTGVLTLTQDGKGGKNLTGTVAIQNGPAVNFTAKFDKKDPSTINGTAKITVTSLNHTFTGKLTGQYNEAFDSFAGQATIKHVSPAQFSATKVVS